MMQRSFNLKLSVQGNSMIMQAQAHRIGLAIVLLVSSMSSPAALASVEVTRSEVAGIDVIVYRTDEPAPDVQIRGLIRAGDALSPSGHPAVAALVAKMLDKGTARQDRAALTQTLKGVGAELSFDTDKLSGPGNASLDRHFVQIDGAVNKEKLGSALSLLAGQLQSPAFPESELATVKRELGARREILENSAIVMRQSFSELAYPEDHPNRWPSVEALFDSIQRATVQDLKQFHSSHYAPQTMTLIFIGNVDAAAVRAAVDQIFRGWTNPAALPGKWAAPSEADTALRAMPGREQKIVAAGEPDVRVALGQATGLQYREPDALALRMASDILVQRLERALPIKDEHHPYVAKKSMLQAETVEDAAWRVTVTFAPEQLEPGLVIVRQEIQRWWQDGITAKELDEVKRRPSYASLTANYIGENIAAALTDAVMQGYPTTWIDEFPKAVQALTNEQVNVALRKHLDPKRMSAAKVGFGSTPEQVVDGIVQAFNAHDVEALLSHYSEGIEQYAFPNQLQSAGKEKMRALYQQAFDGPIKPKLETLSRMTMGTSVIEKQRLTGWLAQSASDGPMEMVTIYQVVNGKVPREYTVEY